MYGDYTPGFQLTAGTSYDYSFWFKTTDATNGYVVTSTVGNSQTVAGQSTILGNITNAVSASGYTHVQYTFVPSTTGLYYFGLHDSCLTTAPNGIAFDDFLLQPSPACAAPTALTAAAITSGGATVSYTAPTPAPASGYIYEVVASGAGSAGTSVSTGTVAAGITSVTITGLTPNTPYDVYVKAVCSNTDTSAWSFAPASFTTTCVAITSIPWTEGFEGLTSTGANILPGCWSYTDILNSNYSCAATCNTNTARTGTHFIGGSWSFDVWDYTPGFQLTAGTSYDYSFYFRTTDAINGYVVTSKVGTSQTIAGMTTLVGNLTNAVSSGVYTKLTYSFTPPTSGVYFFGLHDSCPTSAPNGIAFDDFSLTLTPACSAPTLFTVTNVTSSGGLASWGSTPAGLTGGYHWEVVASGAGAAGTAVASGTTVAGVDSAFITGLLPNTAYDFYVQSNCAGGILSSWAGPASFSTTCTAITSIPWTEGFEGVTPGSGVFPPCWSTVNIAGFYLPGTDNNTTVNTTYGGPHTGRNFLYSHWQNTAWVFTPGFQLTGGTSYDFSFFLENKDPQSPVDFNIEVAYGTSATDAGMTNLLIPNDTVVNTTYRRYLETFTPATSGVYYFGTKTTSTTTSPWYLSFDDFSLQLTPACTGYPDSLSVSGITHSGAIGTWTAATPAPASGYHYEVVLANAGAGSVPIDSGTTAAGGDSAIITGLVPNTSYDFYVQSDCGGTTGVGSWSGPITFTTLCLNSSIPLIEGFNGTTIPSCWSQQYVTGTSDLKYVASSTIPTTTPQEGTDFVLWNSQNFDYYETDTRLVSPPLTTTGTPSVDLDFYWFNENSTFANTGLFLTEGVTVQYSLDGANWTDVQFFPRQDNSLPSGTGQWKKKILTLPVAAANQATVYVGFKFHSEEGDNCSLDNINIFPSLPCAGGPTGATVSNTTTTTTTLSWTAAPTPPAGGYRYVVVAAGDSATGTAITSGAVAAGVTTASVAGLTANTAYDIYIQSNCGGSNGSGYWVGPLSFSTPCNAITTLPWTEGFEGLGANVGVDLLPPCWLGVPLDRWTTDNTPLAFTNLGPRGGNNYLYDSYLANDTIFTPSFTLTGGTQYEFYFYYQTDGSTGWDSLFAMYGTAQSQNGMTTRIGSVVSEPVNTNYVKYSAIFTPATSGTYYFGVKAASSFTDDIAFDDFGLQAVVPCPNPPLAGTISGPASVCSGASVNLSLTGYSPYTTLQWQKSIDSVNYTDIPAATSDYYTDFVSNATYYRVKVKCADSSYTAAFLINLNAPTLCYCTDNLGGGCGGENIDTVQILATNFFVNYTTCNTVNGNAYTDFPHIGDSTTNIQRGGAYTLKVHTTGPAITSAWIDYDQSGTFDSAEWVQPYINATSGTATLNVPSNAILGPTGFRVRSRSGSSPNGYGDPCTQFFSGETFDFLLNIVDTLCNHTPTVTSANTNPTCAGSLNGSIVLTVTGGLSPFAHHWSSGDSTSTLTGITGGIYTDTISFGPGCTYLYKDTLVQPAAIAATIDSTNPVKCRGGSTGNIYITISGGTPGYTSHWSTGSTATSLTGIPAGIYSDTITDLHGCRLVFGPDTIRQPSSVLVVIVDSTHAVKCNGAATGAIYTTASGGTGPYTYLWSNSGHAATGDVTGLSSGTYIVTVSDHNLCSATVSDSIAQPAAISLVTDSVVNAKCHTSADGSIYIHASGGVSPFTYAWTGGAASLDLFLRPAGIYTLTVTDKNTCTATITDTIKAPTAISVSSTINNQVVGGALGAISLTVTGGTPSYHYTWSGSNDSTSSRLNIPAGGYAVTVTDANGCSVTQRDTVDLVTSITETSGDIRHFNIYPNPSSAVFNVVVQLSHTVPVQIETYSVTGQLISVSPQENSNNNTYQIDLSTQAAGIYVVKVKAGEDVIVQRVTVVK